MWGRKCCRTSTEAKGPVSPPRCDLWPPYPKCTTAGSWWSGSPTEPWPASASELWTPTPLFSSVSATSLRRYWISLPPKDHEKRPATLALWGSCRIGFGECARCFLGYMSRWTTLACEPRKGERVYMFGTWRNRPWHGGYSWSSRGLNSGS